MASLHGRTPASSYRELLTTSQLNGIDSNLNTVVDGSGTLTPLSISTTQIAFNGNIWPTSGATPNKVLRVSSTSNQLEWVTLSTSNITEGTNNYFTTERARASFTGDGNITVDQETGVISYTGESTGDSVSNSVPTISSIVGQPDEIYAILSDITLVDTTISDTNVFVSLQNEPQSQMAGITHVIKNIGTNILKVSCYGGGTFEDGTMCILIPIQFDFIRLTWSGSLWMQF